MRQLKKYIHFPNYIKLISSSFSLDLKLYNTSEDDTTNCQLLALFTCRQALKFLLEPRSIKLRVTSCRQLLNDKIIIQSFVLHVRASQTVVLLSFSTMQFSCADEMLTMLERPSQMLEGCCSVITAVNRKSFKISMRKFEIYPLNYT